MFNNNLKIYHVIKIIIIYSKNTENNKKCIKFDKKKRRGAGH